MNISVDEANVAIKIRFIIYPFGARLNVDTSKAQCESWVLNVIVRSKSRKLQWIAASFYLYAERIVSWLLNRTYNQPSTR